MIFSAVAIASVIGYAIYKKHKTVMDIPEENNLKPLDDRNGWDPDTNQTLYLGKYAFDLPNYMRLDDKSTYKTKIYQCNREVVFTISVYDNLGLDLKSVDKKMLRGLMTSYENSLGEYKELEFNVGTWTGIDGSISATAHVTNRHNDEDFDTILIYILDISTSSIIQLYTTQRRLATKDYEKDVINSIKSIRAI